KAEPVAGRFSKNLSVLLCEDQPDLREVTASALRKHGMTVIEASDGREGLKAFGESQKSIELIITDVIMPNLGGPEMVKELGRRHPSRRPLVLFLSGYADNRLAGYQALDEDVQFLEKPYTQSMLIEKIHAMLNHANATQKGQAA
ncbi:MAG TPA: response regulator, partial [Bdellovibrionales bacterium]|nr:response regulator [Bdellovibrionales bacterium]